MSPIQKFLITLSTVVKTIGLGSIFIGLAACKPVPRDSLGEVDFQSQKPSFSVHLISRDISSWLGESSYQRELEQNELDNKLDVNEKSLNRARSIAARIIDQAIQMYPFSQEWEWELHVLESDEFNANCRGNGKMIVNSFIVQEGLFDDHQVALVIGHEIAHALLEHTRAGYGRWAIAAGGGSVLAQSFKMGRVRSGTMVSGVQSLSLPIDREDERQADSLGLVLMAKAGFDAVQGASIWQIMNDAQPGSKISNRLELYESSHPSGKERLENLLNAASKFEQMK